jgi:hypothetical protein
MKIQDVILFVTRFKIEQESRIDLIHYLPMQSVQGHRVEYLSTYLIIDVPLTHMFIPVSKGSKSFSETETP